MTVVQNHEYFTLFIFCRTTVERVIFFSCFYACLGAFFAIMMLIHQQTLDENKPKYQNVYSAIGGSPGLGFRPKPDVNESALIHVRQGVEKNWRMWMDQLAGFVSGEYSSMHSDEPKCRLSFEARSIVSLPFFTFFCNFFRLSWPFIYVFIHFIVDILPVSEYEQLTQSSGGSVVQCKKDTRLEPGQVCPFDIRDLGTSYCTKENRFGYDRGNPCLILKLNKVPCFWWVLLSKK